MLDSLRKHATGWVAKVLFGFLVLSFAIWGIGDIFRAPHAGSTVAEVAGTDIPAREVSNEFDMRLRQMQQQYGAGIDRRAAVSLGLMNQALEAAVARRLVDAHARDLGLTIADATVAARIRQNQAFQGTAGFERERFDLYLRSIGMTEPDYINAVRADLVRNAIVSAMTGPAGVPDLLAKKLVEYRTETRRGQVLLVESANIEVESPTDEALTAYLSANAKTYEAPEYRNVTLVTLSPDDLVGEIEVSDADVRAAYDARLAQYSTPEQRKLEQLLAKDEATIKRAAELVASGQDFTSVAASMKADGVERSELGPLTEGDLPEGLSQAAWALAANGVSAPVQTPFGWHLLRATEIVPETVKPFDSVKDEIRRELALERATSQLPDFATKLDDELAAGTPLDAAAEQLRIPVQKLENIDSTGQTPANERLAPDRLTADMLTPIFAATEGETSLLEQTEDGHYFIYRIDAITPAHERSLDEVRDQVTAAWRAEEQKKRAHARAVEVRAEASSPAVFDQLAKSNADLRLIAVGPVMRSDDGQAQGLGAPVIQAMFATKAGEVAADVVDLPTGSAVVAVDEIIPAVANEQMVSATAQALLDSMRGELLSSYETALRENYKVTVNQATLAQLMEQNAQ